MEVSSNSELDSQSTRDSLSYVNDLVLSVLVQVRQQ